MRKHVLVRAEFTVTQVGDHPNWVSDVGQRVDDLFFDFLEEWAGAPTVVRAFEDVPTFEGESRPRVVVTFDLRTKDFEATVRYAAGFLSLVGDVDARWWEVGAVERVRFSGTRPEPA